MMPRPAVALDSSSAQVDNGLGSLPDGETSHTFAVQGDLVDETRRHLQVVKVSEQMSGCARFLR